MRKILNQEKSKYIINKNIIYSTINWKIAVDDTERFLDGSKLPCLLIENKADLMEENKIDEMEELKNFSNDNEFINCFRTSAKTGLNINEAMSYLIEYIIKKLKNISEKDIANDRKSIVLEPEKHTNNDKYRHKKSGCC